MRYFKGLPIIAVALAVTVLAGAALADYEVMESSVATLPKGTTLPDDATLNLPAEGRIKLLKTPEGSTHELEGPYEGTVSDYEGTQDCPWWQRISVGCDGQRAPIGVRSTPSPDR